MFNAEGLKEGDIALRLTFIAVRNTDGVMTVDPMIEVNELSTINYGEAAAMLLVVANQLTDGVVGNVWIAGHAATIADHLNSELNELMNGEQK